VHSDNQPAKLRCKNLVALTTKRVGVHDQLTLPPQVYFLPKDAPVCLNLCDLGKSV
jgi:hypothetical protein